MHAYIQTYIHTCMHTYIIYIHPHIHTYIHTSSAPTDSSSLLTRAPFICICIHTENTHTHTHTHMHACMYACIHAQASEDLQRGFHNRHAGLHTQLTRGFGLLLRNGLARHVCADVHAPVVGQNDLQAFHRSWLSKMTLGRVQARKHAPMHQCAHVSCCSTTLSAHTHAHSTKLASSDTVGCAGAHLSTAWVTVS